MDTVGMSVLRRAAGTVVAMTLALSWLAATPAVADEVAATQLSITIDNEQSSVQSGDELTYTLTVHNLGAEPIAGLLVTQSLPPELSLKTADAGGVGAAGAVTWQLDLEGQGDVTLTTTVTVEETPDTLMRLASIGCARATLDSPPIVCATDSDQLPAGAAVDEAAAQDHAESPASGVPWVGLAVGAGVLVLVVAAGILLLLLRRRRRA